ncbi:MAG: SCO family protein, partial [Bacteroidia bacterium]|nr:SCO family protein [Bacteroidia bacterium]
MKRSTGKIILVIVLALPVLLAVLLKKSKFGYRELPIYTSDEMGTEVPYTIDSFLLTDQNNSPFTRDSIGDKIFISNFFFTSCPDVCPTINGHIKIATQKLENSTDILFLSHTVDPYNDSVSVMKDYAEMFEANDNQWKFLTGKKSTIYHLARDSYKAVIQEVPDTNTFIHSEKIMLIDKQFRVRGIYNGMNFDEVMDLIKDARFLLKTYADQR